MSPFPGSQKRGAEGGGALRLSDLVMSGVTALLPEREVGRGRRGASASDIYDNRPADHINGSSTDRKQGNIIVPLIQSLCILHCLPRLLQNAPGKHPIMSGLSATESN